MTWVLFIFCLLMAAGLLFVTDEGLEGAGWIAPPCFAMAVLGILACIAGAGRIAGVW